MLWCHYRAAEIWEAGSREKLELLLVGMEDEPQVWVDMMADFSVMEVVVVEALVDADVDVDVDEDDVG